MSFYAQEMKARQSGRTTRMLEEAIRQAQGGRAVYIIVNAPQVKDLERRLRAMLRAKGAEEVDIDSLYGIKVETERSTGNFSWERIELRGAHRNCVVLVDHHTIASRYGSLLEMFHRFDKDDDT